MFEPQWQGVGVCGRSARCGGPWASLWIEAALALPPAPLDWLMCVRPLRSPVASCPRPRLRVRQRHRCAKRASPRGRSSRRPDPRQQPPRRISPRPRSVKRTSPLASQPAIGLCLWLWQPNLTIGGRPLFAGYGSVGVWRWQNEACLRLGPVETSSMWEQTVLGLRHLFGHCMPWGLRMCTSSLVRRSGRAGISFFCAIGQSSVLMTSRRGI